MKRLFYYITHLKALINRLRITGKNPMQFKVKEAMKYDMERYIRYAGIFNTEKKDNLLAQIIHTYHGIEKGLTMPNRRYNFGQDAIMSLVSLLSKYIYSYGEPTGQVAHGIGILKAYLIMHSEYDGQENILFWQKIHNLTDKYPQIQPAIQPHKTAVDFYRDVYSDFKRFAMSRHTLRHYEGSVSENEIKEAVELAMTAPSACNRQPVRIHCISDKKLKNRVLDLQSGNRGFGKDADKVLIVTGDLSSICWVDERYDIYTNCGIFIMNLCYSLFYYKIAHCVLNWSICVDAAKDAEIHRITGIPESEVVAAMITCGRTPTEIDVAMSPRKNVNEILTFH